MADVLVTGATGLLGASVVRLLAGDHRVWAIARRPPEDHGGVCWVTHDLRRPALPADLPGHVDVVIHLAQAREFREFPARAPDTYAVNVGSTALLLDFAVAAGARQFIVASTGGVYDRGSEPHQEDEPTRLEGCPSFYLATKMASEVLVRAFGSQFGVCVLRPFFIYGRGQDAAMLLPRLVERLRAGQTISLDGVDGMRFNPVHVSDAARAVVSAMELGDSWVVNVAGPQVLSLREAVEELAAQLGVPAQIAASPRKSPTDYLADMTRMTALLPAPRVTLREAAVELCG